MALPNTDQLRTDLATIADCDSLAGPVLQLVGVVFAVQAAQAQAQKEITRFVKDIERTRQKFNDEDFREKFSDEIENLNIFDKAFKDSFSTDLSSLVSQPFNQSMLSPDSFSTQNFGGFGMFPATGLEDNNLGKFSPMSLTGGGPGGSCNTQGVGSLGSVQFESLDQTTSQFRKASSSLAGIGMSLANDPTRAMEFATISAGKLAASFVTRRTLLEDIQTSVDTLENLLLQLGDDDYNLKFDEVIADAKKHVDASLDLLDSIIDDLAASGVFKNSEKNELKDELQQAADELKLPTGFPKASGYRAFLYIQAILIAVDQQLRILKSLDSRILVTLPNLASFSANLVSNFKLSNHFGGMFSVIRCGLNDVSKQMSMAQQSNNMLVMMSLIPKWRITILTYRQMVEVAAQDPTPPLTASMNSVYGSELTTLEQAAADATTYVNETNSDDVITKVRNFMTTAQTRLVGNIGDAVVEQRAQIARNALTQATSAQTSIENALAVFGGNTEEQKARADAFYRVMEAAPYLYAVSDAIATASWDQFFSADALESSAKAMLGKFLAAAAQCIEDKNDVAAEAIRKEATRQVQENRLEDMSRKYVYDVSSRLQGLGITEILLLKSRLKRIQSLLQLPAFGGAFPSRDVFAP